MGCKADLKRAKILNGSSNIDDYTIRYSKFFSFLRLLDIRVQGFFFNILLSGFYTFALVEK